MDESHLKQAQEIFDTICVWLQEYNIDERLWLEELITECGDTNGTANKDLQRFLVHIAVISLEFFGQLFDVHRSVLMQEH